MSPERIKVRGAASLNSSWQGFLPLWYQCA
jgi:hypothetical protein